jgi:hypothetical protein
MRTETYEEQYARIYGRAPEPDIDDVPKPDQQKSAHPQQSKKHAALEKFKLADVFVKAGMRNCTSSAAATWFALWNFSDYGVVDMSHQQIGEALGKCKATGRRGARELEQKGYVTVLRRGSEVSGLPNVYQLHPTPPLTAL